MRLRRSRMRTQDDGFLCLRRIVAHAYFGSGQSLGVMRAADNPFSVDRVLRVRYRPREWTWAELLDRLAALRYRAAVVGPEGSGKTTLVEDLGDRLAERGLRPRYATLTRQQRRLCPDLLHWLDHAGPSDLLCLDGCEQLGPVAWWRLRRRCRRLGGLIITLHRPGRLPTLVTCDTDGPLLLELVRELSPDDPCDLAGAEALLRNHDGNIRLALRSLYDQWWQRQQEE